MKKFIALTLSAILLFGICACTAAKPAENPEQSAAPTPSVQPSAEPTPEPTAEQPAHNYEHLDEFIEIINSISDPPELGSDKEYDAYYKSLYDEWKAGNIFSFITEDANGVPVIEDHTNDFVGDWLDGTSQRATMKITSTDGVYFDVEINWADSAADSTQWRMTGTYNPDENAIEYASGQKISMTDPELTGETKNEVVYEDGAGMLKLEDGKLLWRDDKEEAAKGTAFERQTSIINNS